MSSRVMIFRIFGTLFILVLLISGCSSLDNLFWDEVARNAAPEGSGETGAPAASNAGKGPSSKTGSGSSDTSSRPASGPQWNQMMTAQAQVAFSYAFSAGGLWAGQVGYKPGEFTKFDWSDGDEVAITIERAYLRELNDGNQWWRVMWDDGGDEWVWEALIDPEEGQMLRMRARDPDGNQGEVPVTGQAVYMPAAELTRESVQGATVDKGKVTVPAGRFQADHVVYMSPGGEGNVEFWLAPQIPGGVVKYLISATGDDVVWSSELADYGRQATTILGSF